MNATTRDDPDHNHDHFNVRDVVASYNAKAPTLVRDYEDLLFEEVHAPVLDLLPDPGAHILDMGAGSGRDAAWFAANGYKVLATEPATEMRNLGKALHPSPNIRWLDDALPTQEQVLRSKLTFDLIWLSAVWMHVPPSARARAFRKLVSVMSPGGSMMLTLRQGPTPADRPMEPATAADVEVLARRHGLQTVRSERIPDILGRDGIAWEVIWLRLPDDGTGALPLLRHVVLNDRKSSTYKLALLRTVIRVADGAGGLARPGRDERFVDLPLGLVALFWVRSFKPLIAKNLPQHPAGNARLAFVKDGFRRAAGAFRARSQDRPAIPPATMPGTWSSRCATPRSASGTCPPRSPRIREVPIPSFRAREGRCGSGIPCAWDEAFLWSFGTFSVPVNLWQAMSRYAAWIEPAVLNEWIEMMRGYAHQPDSRDAHMAALKWLEPGHDTGLVRGLGRRLRESGARLYCVWTGNRLKRDFDIDHCFPFAAWPCNDLWNLLPSAPAVNRSKGDRLPAAEALERSRSCILDWWDLAYRRDLVLRNQFEDEARSALPAAVFGMEKRLAPEVVFEGLMVQQMVLRRDQQLAVWRPSPA